MISTDRRGFLAAAGAGILALTGCTVSDPRIVGGPTAPPPQPSPSPLPTIPGQQVAIGLESELAASCARLQQNAGGLQLPAPQAAAAGWLAAAHQAHLTALLGVRPSDRPTTLPTPDARWSPRPVPTPTVTLPTDRAAALRVVTELEGRGTDPYRESALAGSGTTALLWGSLAAYTRAAAVLLGSTSTRPEPPAAEIRPPASASDVEAPQQLLRQTDALVYGYQVAIGWLRGAEAQNALTVLGRRRALRDQVTALLRDRGQQAPAAEPAYQLTVQPTDPATARELLWRMEIAFAPFAGGWLAAATQTPDRRLAQEALEDTVQLAVGWGGPLPVWPGWPL
ncbi:DUF4439 domain-containing protein [Enemella evansiae]|uniref:DUF4439 domain-containing protein n=1 Tax=Enemella evansiae TaxID=2016499 RepID=UPI0011406BE8|nr:DUF4439 domain-containing protein [Enemella evansiae]